jgi:hypothetical protein
MEKCPKRAKTKTKYNKLPEVDFDEMIITVKEASKLLGKNASNKMSEEDLTRLIGTMHKMADSLIRRQIVPKNKKGGII